MFLDINPLETERIQLKDKFEADNPDLFSFLTKYINDLIADVPVVECKFSTERTDE